MSARTYQTFSPPVMEARRWIAGMEFPAEKPLINLSQAAPADPPPENLRNHMADLLRDPGAVHLYGAVLGLPELRAQIAQTWADDYGGRVDAGQVAITAGCNQAFTATLAALCGEGDEIIIPTPYYFNHAMACDLGGVKLVPLPVGADMLPDPEYAARLITPRTRAILLITPNNPTGAEYPAALLARFRDLARRSKLKLIVDETYRDFHSQSGAPHDLFADPDWADTIIQLYSFSKSFRLTGYRVGAITADESLLREVEKYLDTVTICPAQIGQHGALWGLQNLTDWLAGERQEMLARRAAMAAALNALPDWQLLDCGAYFAYARIPDAAPGAPEFAQYILHSAHALLLPGTMFRPANDPNGVREMRIAFANADCAGIKAFAQRLKACQ